MREPTTDDLLRIIGHARDRQFADLVVIVLGLAATTNPEEVRKALAGVFDLKGLEDMAARILNVATAAQQTAAKAREEFRSMCEEVQALRKELAAIQYEREVQQATPRLFRPAANGTKT